MSKIVLISCVSKKQKTQSKAKDLYISPLFKKNLQYAKSLNPDKIYILSAKYGLINLDTKIDPYDQTLNKMSQNQIKDWSNSILNELKKSSNINTDEFIFLAGIKYRKYILPFIKNYKIPMQGLSIGKQLQWLSKEVLK
jgi:hypothetical protein